MASLAVQRRSMQMVPRLGSEADMTKEAIEQLRARVAYQKSLLSSKNHSIQEEVDEMWRWVNITFWVGFPIVLASAFFSMFFDEHRKWERGGWVFEYYFHNRIAHRQHSFLHQPIASREICRST